jgi:DNA-binding transcriptional LysR family regulator
MKLSVRHIEVFRAIMAAGSVTGAARLLFTSQPTVSRELARMEQVTGLNLFDRERAPGAHRPGPAADRRGRARLRRPGAHRPLCPGHPQLRARPAGHHLPAAVLANPAAQGCQRFHQQHRGVSVSITAQESPLLEESLVAQQHDLGLTEVEQIRWRGGRVAVQKWSACCPRGTRCRPKVLELSDFDEVDFINLASLDTYRQQLGQHFRAAGVNRRTVIETTSAASVCAMVRQGWGGDHQPVERAGGGAGWVADSAVEYLGAYRVMLIQPEHRPTSAVVEPFCQALREQAREMTAALGGSSAQVAVESGAALSIHKEAQ